MYLYVKRSELNMPTEALPPHSGTVGGFVGTLMNTPCKCTRSYAVPERPLNAFHYSRRCQVSYPELSQGGDQHSILIEGIRLTRFCAHQIAGSIPKYNVGSLYSNSSVL